MRNMKLVTCAITASFLIIAPALSQSHRRTDREDRTNNPGEPARPRAGGPAITTPPGNTLNSDLGSSVDNFLKPRQLKDADLSDADSRKYSASVTTIEKQAAAPARKNQQPSPTQPIASAFRLGAMHLRYGQETKALEAFTKGWAGMTDLLKEAKTTAAAVTLAKTHLVELQKLAQKDPALVLALMGSLTPQHEAAFKAIELVKLKPQLGLLLAGTWTQLLQFGQLDKDSLGKGAGWVLMFPSLVTANRLLPPEMRNEYETQLAQVTIKINELIRLLAERQRTQAMGSRAPMPSNTNAEAQGNDPMLQQTMANLDAKRGPLMQFMRADVAFRFGQFQDGLRASTLGWKELVEFYRSGGGATPADTQMHFDTLNQIATANSIQGAVMLDQLDPVYRMVASTTPFVGIKVADTWTKLTGNLPLRAAMLEKALFWVEVVGKSNKDAQARYTTSLAEIKKKLQEARKNEGVKDDDEDDDADEKHDPRHKAGHGESPRAKTPPQQSTRNRFNIPKSIGPSGSGQEQHK